MSKHLYPYTVQTWRDQTHVGEDFIGLSLDAAREIARTHRALGDTVRLMAEGTDYCEVYPPDSEVRCGTFAETTLVRVERSAR